VTGVPGSSHSTPFKLRDVVQDTARDDSVFPRSDIVLLTPGLARNVVGDRVAVVHLALEEVVTERVHMSAGQAVEVHLVVVLGADFGNVVCRAVEDRVLTDVRGDRLRDEGPARRARRS
jgi:hypothetical protein